MLLLLFSSIYGKLIKFGFFSNDFHIKKESYKNNIFETVVSNPFDGITSAPVAGGAAAGHDPFGIQNLKAPKSDTLPEPPKMPEVADASPPSNNEPSAAGGEGNGGEGVFAVPAALEATVLPKDEIAEEKAEEAVPRNAEEKAEHERNKKEEPKTQEEKKVEKEEEKKVEAKKEEVKKVEVVVPVVEEIKKADLPVVVLDEEKKKE